MDVWEIIRRSAMNDGLAAEEREAVLDLCSAHASQMAELRSAAESAGQERDRLSEELEALKRTAAVKSLAEKHNFIDPEYLDFLLKKMDTQIDDPVSADAAVTALKSECPRFFKVDLLPAGTGGTVPVQSSIPPIRGNSLTELVSNAPEAGY